MSIVNKKTLRYTIINGNFNNRKNITTEMLSLILTANAVIYDEYINIDFLNDLPIRPSCFHKVVLHEQYDSRIKQINELVVQLALRYGHVVHLKGLNHLFFEDFYPSIKYVRSFKISTKTINLNFTIPELVLN